MRVQIEALLKLIARIPDEISCPVLKTEMVNPLIAADGHTYEAECIKKWITDQKEYGAVRSPLAGINLESLNTINNHKVKSLSDFLKTFLPYQLVLANYLKSEPSSSVESKEKEVKASSNNSATFSHNPQFFKMITLNPQQQELQAQLVSACEKGNLPEVKMLAQKGADLNLPDKYGKYPLGAAAWGLNPEIVEYIVETLKPKREYIAHCWKKNIEIYDSGESLPIFKESKYLNLEDLCKGYTSKLGREVVFSKWVWESLDKNRHCWESIDAKEIEINNPQSTANTRDGEHWTFGSSKTTVQECANQHDNKRAIVWMAFMRQYEFCATAAEKIKNYFTQKMSISLEEETQKIPVINFK